MNFNLTNEEIQKIREVSIHRILGLLDSGRRLSIRCMFHNEKSPSLVLYPDNSFHCFGCGKNGQGAIDFCMALGFDFKKSCEELGKYL